MTEPVCTYPGDRDEALITMLYDDGGAEAGADRARFEAHLRTCAACRGELDTLRGVRAQLARWTPPEPTFGPFTASSNPQSVIPDSRAPWRVPAWAQAVAAVLVLGVAAGIANIDVHYDQSGLTIRTGWSSRGAALAAQPASASTSAGADAAPWRADLAALERQLRSELRPSQPANAAAVQRSSDADVVRRVRALVDDSEKRQQRELALRIAELMRDVNVQRQADLVRVDRALGLVENKVGVEVLKNRQQMNYFIRTSQRQ